MKPSKPRLFIGSSNEGIRIAEAVQANLERNLECTLWGTGVFELSKSTLTDLIKISKSKDFSIFVFSPDDILEKRGELFVTPRDNVIFEFGLFIGELGLDRCFFLVPSSVKINIPSDFLGITHGEYDDKRSDENWQASVVTFCSKIRLVAKSLGYRHDKDLVDLALLAKEYECCEWIPDEAKRIRNKDAIFNSMKYFCKSNFVNKKILLSKVGYGFAVALAAAIVEHPETGDEQLLQQIPLQTLPQGNAQHKILDAIDTLDRFDAFSNETRRVLVTWLRRMPEIHVSERINQLESRVSKV